MANICRKRTVLTVYQSLCLTFCQTLLTAILGYRFHHAFITNVLMKKLRFIQHHTDNKWQIQDFVPIDTGWAEPVHRANSIAAILAKSLHHRV